MNLTKNIFFKNFSSILGSKSLKKDLTQLINKKNEVLNSLSKNYKYSCSLKEIIKQNKNNHNLRIIGIGGSILGAKAIYNFLKFRIKKKVYFVDNLKNKKEEKKFDKKIVNLIISKSGNTLETISNTNLLVKKNHKNIFLIQRGENYLRNLANKLKAEIIDHNNYIGGRYSVLSEVGMVPASLFGFSEKKFKQFNKLINDKKFINLLIHNVSNIIFFLKKKKFNSVILNYDESSDDLFKWYQQLVAESLGKKGKGVLPVISSMPKDNHSLMQLFLDGQKTNFYTFFSVNESSSCKIKNNLLLKSHYYLKNKNLNNILNAQKLASENTFRKRNIPFRSFMIKKRNEETLGELFSFFVLETILLGKALKVNPYDQPAVELIKKDTKKILIK